MDRTPRSIADYDAMMDPIRAARQAKEGKQPGDPAKAAQAPLTLVAVQRARVRLVLGNDALALVTQKLEAMRMESLNGMRFPARPVLQHDFESQPIIRLASKPQRSLNPAYGIQATYLG
jgi:hypothetical protein